MESRVGLRRVVRLLPVVVLALGGLSPARAEAPPAILIGDEVMVPMRTVMDWLGGTLTYAQGKITAVRGEDAIGLAVGSTEATVNGRPQPVVVPPMVRGGVLYIALKFMASNLDATSRCRLREREVTMRHEGLAPLVLTITLPTPAELAVAVFKAYLRQGPMAEREGKKLCVCFDPLQYPWMRGKGAPYMTDDNDLARWPYTDRRFRQLLQQQGWKKGDVWFPYEVIEQTADKMWIQFSHRWWGASVELRYDGVRWQPVLLSAFDEGVDREYNWTVTTRGAEYHLTQQQQ